MKQPLGILTDSHSSISPEAAEALGVRVLPMPFMLDGQTWLEPVDDILALADAIRRKGKWIPVNHPVYRIYVFFWFFTRPVRGILVRVKRMLRGGRLR